VSLTGTGVSALSIVAATPTLNLASAGGSATSAIQLSGQNGFTGTAALSCTVQFQGSGTPNASPSCSLSPAQVQVTSGATAASTLTVSIPTTTASEGEGRHLSWSLAAMLFLGVLPLRRWRGSVLLTVIGVVCAGCMLGCGGGSSGGSTPPPINPGSTAGAYQVTVTATSGKVTSSANVTVNVQ
jgi:hypothetical protein